MPTALAPSTPDRPVRNLYGNRAHARISRMAAKHDPEALGKFLVQLRENRGWRQAYAARQAGMSHPYLSVLENPGKRPRRPTANRLRELASAWGLRRTEREELFRLAGYELAEVAPSGLRTAYDSPHDLTTEELERHIAVMRAIVEERARQEAQRRAQQDEDSAQEESSADDGTATSTAT